jgi:hypothetical protein
MEQDEAPMARVHFLRAVHQLTVSTDSLQERLSAAWVELLAVRRDDLPPALREPFAVVAAEVLAAPDDPATLDDETALVSAERLLRLALELLGT